MQKIIFLLLFFALIVTVFFFKDGYPFVLSEKQRMYRSYEKIIIQKTETVLEHLLPKSAFDVIATVDLSHEVIKESSLVKTPHIKKTNDIELLSFFEKNREEALVNKKEKRDFNQPGFREIMPKQGVNSGQIEIKPRFHDSERTQKNEKIEDEIFIDTLTKEEIRDDNMLKAQSVFVLLDQSYELSITQDQLKSMLEFALGFDKIDGDVISIQEIAFYPKQSWLSFLKQILSPYMSYVKIGFFLLLFLFSGMFFLFFYFKKKSQKDPSPNQKMLDLVEEPVTLNEKKSQILELSKSDPEKIGELVKQWMKK